MVAWGQRSRSTTGWDNKGTEETFGVTGVDGKKMPNIKVNSNVLFGGERDNIFKGKG